MTPARIHYSDHAVKEMRKARMGRGTVRRVLAHGVHEIEAVTGETYYQALLQIENREYGVIYLKKKGHLLIVRC